MHPGTSESQTPTFVLTPCEISFRAVSGEFGLRLWAEQSVPAADNGTEHTFSTEWPSLLWCAQIWRTMSMIRARYCPLVALPVCSRGRCLHLE